MIPAKFWASIIFLLTLINAFPLQIADDPSIIQQVNDLVERQTLPPTSVPATESVNLTGVIDTFGELAVDLNGIAGVLGNLTGTLRTELSDASREALHTAAQSLERFTKDLMELINLLDGKFRTIPIFGSGGPIGNLLGALLESLNILLKNLMNVEDALDRASAGDLDLDSLRPVFTALQESLKALLVVLSMIIRLNMLLETPSSGNSNGFTEFLNSVTNLEGVLKALEALLLKIGISP